MVPKDSWLSDARNTKSPGRCHGSEGSERTRRPSKAHWQFTHSNTLGRRFGEGGRGICNHTDTTRGYISSNHDGALASLELVQDPIALILLLVTVNGCGLLVGKWKACLMKLTKRRPSILSEESGNVVGNPLGACEDQDLVVLIVHDLLKMLCHPVALLEL